MRVRGECGGGAGSNVNKPCVVIYGVSQELVVVPLQVFSGKIHGDAPYVVHLVDVEIS